MKRLRRKTKRGFRGYPVGTIAFYGPDDSRASKVVVAILESEGSEPSEMQKWYSEDTDLRRNEEVLEEAVAFLDECGVVSIMMADRIIGCPHEEDIDYEGPTCPECPFWAHRNRWTGEIIH